MTQWEAWTVTALGMGVVYVGLVMCIGFIVLFGRLAPRLAGAGDAHATPADTAATGAPADTAASEPVPPDVLAVIAVLVELERTLYSNRPGARVTIRRHPPVS